MDQYKTAIMDMIENLPDINLSESQNKAAEIAELEHQLEQTKEEVYAASYVRIIIIYCCIARKMHQHTAV